MHPEVCSRPQHDKEEIMYYNNVQAECLILSDPCFLLLLKFLLCAEKERTKRDIGGSLYVGTL